MYLKIIPIVCLLHLAPTRAVLVGNQECNNTAFVNEKYYRGEKMIAINGIPADLSVNFNTGNIYFTLISNEMKMSIYRLKDGDLQRVNVNNLGQSTAVDNHNNVVYLGTDNGVYKYDEKTGTSQLHAALGDDVMYLDVADNGRTLYTANWPQNRVRKLIGRKSETFAPIAIGHGLTVDNDNNIYYEAAKTLYVLKNGDTVSIKINGFQADANVDFFVTKSGEVFAMDEFSNLYKIDPDNAYATNVGSFGVEGVNTFGVDEEDAILIGVTNAIWKWVPTTANPCLDSNM